MNKKLGGIILAAGKGRRMKLDDVNKVTLSVSGKPLIVENVDLFNSLSITPIVIVVGFAKKSVEDLFSSGVIFAEQKDQLGTAHAAQAGVNALSAGVQHALSVNGDGMYPVEVVKNLINLYQESEFPCMFLTVKLDNPFGIGRIIRDENGQVLSIIEEKDATESVREIKEVNAGCYIGRVDFFKKYLSLVEKSPITGEYYLTDIVNLAIKNKEKIQTVEWGEEHPWVGINTQEDLEMTQESLVKD